MNEILTVLTNTGQLTTVGGPVLMYYCIAKLRGKNNLNWYALAPLIQAYVLTGIYFAVFGPRIVTTHHQTFQYIFIGSHFLTTFLCIIIFLTTSEKRPRREFPWDLKRIIIGIFGVYPSCIACGALFFYALDVRGDKCHGPRCEGYILIIGDFGYTGTLLLPLLLMGAGSMWLNLLCYIYKPYIKSPSEP